MKNEIKAGDLVTLKNYVHRTNWEKIGFVQWTQGNYAAVRWVSGQASLSAEDLSMFPVTQRDLSELEVFRLQDPPTRLSKRDALEIW